MLELLRFGELLEMTLMHFVLLGNHKPWRTRGGMIRLKALYLSINLTMGGVVMANYTLYPLKL